MIKPTIALLVALTALGSISAVNAGDESRVRVIVDGRVQYVSPEVARALKRNERPTTVVVRERRRSWFSFTDARSERPFAWERTPWAPATPGN